MSDSQESDSLTESSSGSVLIINESSSSDDDPPIPIITAADGNKKYIPWTATEQSMENDDYCDFLVLLNTFNKIENYDLNCNTMRNDAVFLLNNVPTTKIISKSNRFPYKHTCVNLTQGFYACLVKRIIAALDCENNCTEGGQQIMRCSCKEIFYLRLSCAQKLHLSVPLEHYCIYGIYTQESFERWHALEWQ